ncbi:MAG: Monofunctional biosynthetic peptidoglycan transglycosylase [Bryobacterales bacterium]|jgi:monofunctional biosynthetic peptidoglycan transglycosylase|nr:Monofunctional biosynthetic peptidoglycan transglycosylase [Bryobacterales bacterium]
MRKPKPRPRWARWIAAAVLFVVGLHVLWGAALLALRYIDPPTTGVQIQRRVESIFARGAYKKRYTFVPLRRISTQLQHAVIAAEDGNFYRHYGIDWGQVRQVIEDSADSGEVTRGASTIPQQLVKNLFFTTHRNPVRKAFEYTLAPMAVMILGRNRVLELYLNVIEWGPGVYGAEAAAVYHYRTSAAALSREQATRLAAILPSPRRRRPERMNQYSAIIQDRMRLLGW